MHKLIASAVVFVVVAGFEPTGNAKPCRVDVPDCRRPVPRPAPPPPTPPPTVSTTIFQRVVPATPRGNLFRLLAGSLWSRLGSREQIRFVEPRIPSGQQFARPPDGSPPSRDRSIRSVTIDVIRDRGALLVNIDGWLYTVTRCPMLRPARPRPVAVMTTCLEHRAAGDSFGGNGYGGSTYGGR